MQLRRGAALGWIAGFWGVAVASLVQAETATLIKGIAYARVEIAKRASSDPELVGYVVAKNNAKEPMEEVRRKDLEWTGQRDYPLKKQLVDGRCTRRLRSLLNDDTLLVEAILMDAQGANVCMTSVTSDYWQGDEDKWRKTFLEGNPFFIDEPGFDQSTSVFAIQLSVPVAHEGRRIGALTLTLKIKKEQVR